MTMNVLFCCCSGQSLNLSPRHQADSGGSIVLQCILVGDSSVFVGTFTWTGPALSSAVPGRTSITLDSSGTVSRLTINGVLRSDAGTYSCSYANLQVSTTLTVSGMPLSLHYTRSCTYYKSNIIAVMKHSEFLLG